VSFGFGCIIDKLDLTNLILPEHPTSMRSKNRKAHSRSEVTHSPGIYEEEFTGQEDAGKRHKRKFGGTRLKSIIAPRLHWLLLHTPISIAKAPVRLAIFLLRGLYWWPRNPLRLSCEHICNIAQRAGHKHQARQVYQQLLTNLFGAMENYFDLYDRGPDFTLDRVRLSGTDSLKVNQLINEHGGVLIMVPHNFGTTHSTLKMNRTLPLLAVVRNSPTRERSEIAVDYFTRMQTEFLLVRDGKPIQLTRTLFSVLKSDKAVLATVDKLDRSENRIEVDMFGSPVGFSPWATKIAARLQIPIIPSYCKSRGHQLSIILGSPLVSKDPGELTQHYARFFEQKIIEDPASWAFLGDKHWGKALYKANARLDNF
jgi:lauroyl/myristoyl acyltransferase